LKQDDLSNKCLESKRTEGDINFTPARAAMVRFRRLSEGKPKKSWIGMPGIFCINPCPHHALMIYRVVKGPYIENISGKNTLRFSMA